MRSCDLWQLEKIQKINFEAGLEYYETPFSHLLIESECPILACLCCLGQRVTTLL